MATLRTEDYERMLRQEVYRRVMERYITVFGGVQWSGAQPKELCAPVRVSTVVPGATITPKQAWEAARNRVASEMLSRLFNNPVCAAEVPAAPTPEVHYPYYVLEDADQGLIRLVPGRPPLPEHLDLEAARAAFDACLRVMSRHGGHLELVRYDHDGDRSERTVLESYTRAAIALTLEI